MRHMAGVVWFEHTNTRVKAVRLYRLATPQYMVRHRGNDPRTPCLMVEIVGSAPT